MMTSRRTTPRALTLTQTAVALHIAQGLSRAEVAEALGCSTNTIDAHLRAISLKLPGRGSLVHRIYTWAQERAA